MKKIKIVFYTFVLCLLSCFFFASCTSEDSESSGGIHGQGSDVSSTPGDASSDDDSFGSYSNVSIRYEDVSIEITLDAPSETIRDEAKNYFYLAGSNTLLRFNKVTGQASSVCPDPLCNHDSSDCDFFSKGATSLFSVSNNLIYYVREGRAFFSDELWVYDINTGKAQKLYDAYYKILTVQAIPSGCYFTDVAVQSGSNPSESDYRTAVYFIDQSETITKLATFKGIYYISSARDGKLWWYGNSGGDYVSDLYGKNFTSYDTATQRPKRENYEFFVRSLGFSNGRAHTVLMRTDLNTGEQVQLLDNCAFYTIHGDRIYYLEYLEESRVIGPQANGTGEYKDSYGGKLYSMNFDGEDKKLVVDDENIHFMKLPSIRNSPHMDDRYMGILLTHYEETAKGLVSYSYRSMLIYDTQTGEYKVSVYEP